MKTAYECEAPIDPSVDDGSWHAAKLLNEQATSSGADIDAHI